MKKRLIFLLAMLIFSTGCSNTVNTKPDATIQEENTATDITEKQSDDSADDANSETEQATDNKDNDNQNEQPFIDESSVGYSQIGSVESVECVYDDKALLLGSDGKGIYLAESGNTFDIYYQTFDGTEKKNIYHEDKYDFSYSNQMSDEGLVFVRYGEEISVMLLNPLGENKTLHEINGGGRFPEISLYGEWMFVSYTDESEGKSYLYKINMINEECDEIYNTDIEYQHFGEAIGDRIVFSGGTDEKIYFQVMHLENQYDEQCEDVKIYVYDNGKTEYVMTPEDICTAITGCNDRIFLMEYSTDNPNIPVGKIYDTDGKHLYTFSNLCSGDTVREYTVYGDNIIFWNNSELYIYNTKNDTAQITDIKGATSINVCNGEIIIANQNEIAIINLR